MLGRPIQHYLNAADESGRVTFTTRWHGHYITRDQFKTRQAYLRAHVLAHLVAIRGMVLRLDKVKAAFVDVEARLEPAEGSEPANISFNLARGFSLGLGKGENIFIVFSKSARFCFPISSSGPKGKSPPKVSWPGTASRTRSASMIMPAQDP